MGSNATSHCFPVNGNGMNPRILGIQGILEAYRSTLPMIGLSGPTNFAQVLATFNQHARENA